MIKLWSTAEVHPRDRVAYWVDEVCDFFHGFDCAPQRDRPFFGEIRADTVGDVLVCKVTSTAQLVARSPLQIARDPREVACVCVQLAGRSVFSMDGRDMVLRSGDFLLQDGTRPFRGTYDGDFAQIVLQVPRAALLHRLGAPRLAAVRFDGSAGIGGLLSPMLRELPSRLGEVLEATQERIAGNLLDLIATAVLSKGQAPLSPRLTLARVKLWVETHLSEELSAERIAGECKLSVRHINRLFAREGTSVMHHVWERRLARCHSDLTDPAMRHRSISDIAFTRGFNDLSHFSRAYRERHGCAPSEARRVPEFPKNSASRPHQTDAKA